MRGAPSFVLELMPVVFALGFLIAVWRIWWRGPLVFDRRGRLLVSLAALVMLALVGQRFVHQLGWRRALAELMPERVRHVELDRRMLEDPAKVTEVLRCLREAEWFSPNHGGWGRAVPLVMTLTDGRTLRLQVARYLREPGAVIAFTRPGPVGSGDDGYAFSPVLTQALSGAGAPLP